MKDFEFKKGQVVTLTYGEGDSGFVRGVFKTLRDFDAQAMLTAFAAITQCDLSDGNTAQHQFVEWLLASGFVEAAPSTTLDLGWYEQVELSQTTPFWAAQ